MDPSSSTAGLGCDSSPARAWCRQPSDIWKRDAGRRPISSLGAFSASGSSG